MNLDLNVIGNIFNFLLVGLVFILVLYITFRITLKRYDFKTSKIKFYGIFLEMNNRNILGFSLITLNYIFLIWCTASFSGINIYYIVITVVLMLGADIVTKKYQRITIDIVYSAINVACIYVTSLIYDYLVNTYTTIELLVVLGLVTLFVFLYFTYITFKLLNSIVVSEENLKKKNYKKV